MAKQIRPHHRLPKAPLAEVVFELRWALQGDESIPFQMRTDPGLVALLDKFTPAIKRAGYSSIREMAPAMQTAGYGITRRYFKGPDQPFPIMQIGQGIFATNESAQYEWKSFLKQIQTGVRTLLNSYPTGSFFSMRPTQIEIRYIDIFEKSLVGSHALYEFLNKGTTLKVEVPAMLNDKKIFQGETKGRLVFQRTLKDKKETSFSLDIGSGAKDKDPIVRMETKIVSKGDDVPKLTSEKTFMRSVEKWLVASHDVISPFFKKLVVPDVMQKFQAG